MKTAFGQLVIAVVLAVTAALLWRAARVEETLADAQRALDTLRFDVAADRLDALPSVPLLRRGGRWGTQAADLAVRTRTLADYWTANDRALTPERDAFLAANAAFRQLRREGGDWQRVAARLDGIVKQYADVVRNDPGNDAAAFNFEFAVRYRLAVANVRQPIPPRSPAIAVPALHGLPGAPPKGIDMKQFKTIVPMRPDERNEAEQAAKGATRVRKG